MSLSGICDPYLNCGERQWDRGDCIILAEGDSCNQISDMCDDGLSCNTDTLMCTDMDGCDGIECGAGATCTDAAAPDTGYSCSCDTGYEGATTNDTAATCHIEQTVLPSAGAPPPSTTTSASSARIACVPLLAVVTVVLLAPSALSV